MIIKWQNHVYFLFIFDSVVIETIAIRDSELTGFVHNLQIEDYLPMSQQKILLLQKETRKDDILSHVFKFIDNNWQESSNKMSRS